MNKDEIEDSILEEQLRESASGFGVCRKLTNLDLVCVDYVRDGMGRELQEKFEIVYYLFADPEFFINYMPDVLSRLNEGEVEKALHFSVEKNCRRLLHELRLLLEGEELWVNVRDEHQGAVIELLSYGLEFGTTRKDALMAFDGEDWAEEVLQNSSIHAFNRKSFLMKRLDALKRNGQAVEFA